MNEISILLKQNRVASYLRSFVGSNCSIQKVLIKIMRQLVFDDKFQNITYEKPNIWKSFLDIPFPVMDFINNTSNKMIIYSMSDNKYYCSVCFHELDNYYL